jgi:competence ComEA-like helix-hairpin-helix protein
MLNSTRGGIEVASAASAEHMRKLAPYRVFRVWLVSLLLASLLCAAGAEGKKKPPEKPLDLNSATSAQLQQLPGIGPVTAGDILQFRAKSGPFRRVEDLLAIRGITRRKLDRLRPYVTVSAAKPSAPGKHSKP